MPVTQQEQVKPCELSLEIEVEQEQVKKAFSDAYKEVGAQTQVPGFRKGKAPRGILEKYVSEERVMERAANKLVQPAFEEAIKEAGVQPFGDAEYEVIHLADAEPFKFKATVPLPPTVELGTYVGLKVDRMVTKVSDEDVDNDIRRMLERMAKVEPVEDRPAKEGDLVILQMAEPNGEVRQTIVEVGKNLPSFDAGLTGIARGETKTIDLIYPEDYDDTALAGTSSHVTVTVSDIKERQIPELTDDLVKEMSANQEEKIETVAELKAKLKESMEKAAVDLADRKVETAIVEKIVETSTINFPGAMLDHEVAHRLQDMLADLEKRKMTLERYLEVTGQRFEDLRSEIEKASERDIRVSLVLDEVTAKEKIEVSDDEVNAELTKMAEEAGYPVESIRAYVDRTGGIQSIKHRVERNKVLDFLTHASNIKNVGKRNS